jgi:hypothetical protein
MDFLTTVVFSMHEWFWLTSLLILIFLIIRRIKVKESEDFEDRDN